MLGALALDLNALVHIAHLTSREGVDLIRAIDNLGYAGDYSFEVFNDDYVQMPLALVAGRARRSVQWITDHVSRRSLPVRRHVAS